MKTTSNIGLQLTEAGDTNLTFLQYRTLMNGYGVNSNMEKIDREFGDINDALPFIAVYEDTGKEPILTPFADIKDAYDSARDVKLLYNSKLYSCGSVTDEIARFSRIDNNKIYNVNILSDGNFGSYIQPIPNVDSTLSYSGEAADAAATGGRIDRLDTVLTRKMEILYALTRGQVWDTDTDETDVLTYIRATSNIQKAFAPEIIGGRTIVMNQIIPATKNSGNFEGVTFTKNESGTWTLNGSPNVSNCYYNLNNAVGIHKFIDGHKYLLSKGTNDSRSIGLYASGLTGDSYGKTSINGDVVFTANTTDSTASWCRIQVSNLVGEIIDNVVITPQCFDLTLMFGKTVSDTIATPEQAYALGVPHEYVPYNAGELKNAIVDAITIHNRHNLSQIVPDSGGTIHLTVGKKYLIRAGGIEYIHTPSSNIAMECEAGDEVFNLTAIFGEKASSITQPSDAYALGVPTYHVSNSISMIIPGDETERMNIPASVRGQLTGYGWSAGTAYNSIKYDADTDKWTYIHRVASVDLGTLTWEAYTPAGTSIREFRATLNPALLLSGEYRLMCAKYTEVGSSTGTETMPDQSIKCQAAQSRIYIRDDAYSSDTPAQFKAHMNGVMLHYALSAETREDITDMMPPYTILDCSGDGMCIMFNNANALPVYNRGTFFVKLSEVMQNG